LKQCAQIRRRIYCQRCRFLHGIIGTLAGGLLLLGRHCLIEYQPFLANAGSQGLGLQGGKPLQHRITRDNLQLFDALITARKRLKSCLQFAQSLAIGFLLGCLLLSALVFLYFSPFYLDRSLVVSGRLFGRLALCRQFFQLGQGIESFLCQW